MSTTQSLAAVLETEGRERYLRVLAGARRSHDASDPDVEQLLHSALRRTMQIEFTAAAFARDDCRLARARVAWALADVHRALAAESLAAGIDPDTRLDAVVAAAAAKARATDGELTAAFVHQTLLAADHDLWHAHRFARRGGFPDVLRDWIAAAAEELLIVHVAASLLAELRPATPVQPARP